MPTLLDDDYAKANVRSFPELTRNNSCHSSFEIKGRQEHLRLLVRRIEQLPPKAKKVLAMYYYENLKLSEIATYFRMSESQIDEMLTETVDSLKDYLDPR